MMHCSMDVNIFAATHKIEFLSGLVTRP